MDRLIDANRNGANLQSWNLDELGNWSGTTIGAYSQTRSYNAANEIDTDDPHGNAAGNAIASTMPTLNWIDPTYDAAGNMISGPRAGMEMGRLWYVYDGWNRLVEVHYDDNGTMVPVAFASYEYDAAGRRIEKTTGGATLDYFWSAPRAENVLTRSTIAHARGRTLLSLLLFLDGSWAQSAVG